MKLSQILFKDEYVSDFDPEEVEIKGICSNTKENMEGRLFVAICGTNVDTHCMLGYIKDMGAAGILIQEGCECAIPEGIPCFRVKNTRAMLAHLWSRFCQTPEKKLKIIGITGTNGKTSTAFMLHDILKAAKIPVGLIGTIGCFCGEEPIKPDTAADDTLRMETMTTPDPDFLYPILQKMVDKGVTHVVMEVSSHALYFDKCEPINFEMGIFTNLASDHMDLHQTKTAYQKAKEKLFQKCKIGIWNQDDPACKEMSAAALCENKYCSLEHTADFYIKSYTMQGIRGLSFMLCGEFGRLTISMQIPGRFTLYNAMLAASGAIMLGISPVHVRRGLQDLAGVKGRIERLDIEKASFSVFIDYAHTEEALRTLLTTVREFCTRDERIVAVFGCGGDRDPTKRSLMGKCAEELADFSIITSDNYRKEAPRKIILDILKGFHNKDKRRVILDRKNAIEYAIHHARPQDVILLIGKGHENYAIYGDEKVPFDERKIVLDAIKQRNSTHTTSEVNNAN